jgi:hypothetical protein
MEKRNILPLPIIERGCPARDPSLYRLSNPGSSPYPPRLKNCPFQVRSFIPFSLLLLVLSGPHYWFSVRFNHTSSSFARFSQVVHWNRICPSKWSPVYGRPGRPILNLVHCSRITSDTVPKTKWSL